MENREQGLARLGSPLPGAILAIFGDVDMSIAD